MIDELRAMAVFAKTVEKGSFRAAAKELGLSPSVVSHHISQLESRLNVALLYRSTRRISLTDSGERLAKAAQEMLLAAEQGLQHLMETQDNPSGKLWLTLPNMLANHSVTQHIAEFAQCHARVSLHLSYSDHPQDLIRDGIDLAIRIGPLPDSRLKSRKLFDMSRTLVASASYLEKRKYEKKKLPKQPEDLRDWDWIGLSVRANSKVFNHRSNAPQEISFIPRITTDSMEAVYQLCCSGMGLSTPPSFMVQEALRKKLLVEVLPTWPPESLPVYVLWPDNIAPNNLTQRLISFLMQQQEAKN